jgi:hypothetical protein
MQGSCQNPCNGATSSESIIRHSSAVRRERRGQISDVRDGGFARSARTRRPVTRGGLNVRRIQNGIVGIGNLFQYRVESVRHDTSPSCRDCSRQGPACLEDNRDRSRRCPARLHCSSARLRHHACRGSFATSLTSAWRERDRLRSRLETFRQRATVPTLLWVLNRQSLVEASPTCTPPPICTLAPFLKPRWSQDRGRCGRPKEYTKRKDSQRN